MPVHLIAGADPSLVSAALSGLTRELLAGGTGGTERSVAVESHDANVDSGEARTAAVRAAVASAETLSMFAEERVVVLRDIAEATVAELEPLVAYLAHPSDSTHLVLTAVGKVSKGISDAIKRSGATVHQVTPPQQRRELVAWYEQQFTLAGLRVEPRVPAEVAEWFGEDESRLPGLLEVLVSTFGTTRALLLDDIADFRGDAGAVKPWDLTDAIDAHDAPRALQMLRRMLRGNEMHAHQVIAVLHTHYAKVLRLDGVPDLTPADAAARVGSKSEYTGRKYRDLSLELGHRGIADAVALLAQADVDLRGAKDLPDELVLEILVARLCRMGGSSRGGDRGRDSRRRQPAARR